MKRLPKIGIVTWHYYANFGSALQAYALQSAIEQLGYSAEFINYHNPKYGIPSIIKGLIKLVLDISVGSFLPRFRYGQFYFSYKYLKEGKLTTDANSLPDLTKDYRVIVCGSDQIWAPNVYNPVYFASFAQQNTRKVSYAASIGLNDIPSDLIDVYMNHLNQFCAISTREEESKVLLKNRCGIEAQVVLDPTLLYDAAFYKKIERKVNEIKGKYLFCYFLNDKHQYRQRVEYFAKDHNLQIIGVSDKIDDGEWMNRLTKLGADHFIWLINHAEAVMTDSYHGTIFSLLFHKSFWTFVRFSEDSPLCQNSRIRQLQSYFGDNIRVVGQNDFIDESVVVDYNSVESVLSKLRNNSIRFLKNALS